MSENKVTDLIGKYDDPYAELDRYDEFLEGFVKCYGLEEHLLSFLTAYEQNGLLDERDRAKMWDLMHTIAPHLFKDVEDKKEV